MRLGCATATHTGKEREGERETAMPIWTFTSGPHKGKKYEGSAMAVEGEKRSQAHQEKKPFSSASGQEATDLPSVRRLMKDEGLTWGRVDRLTCRRDVTVVATDSKAFLASFDLVKMHSRSRCNQLLDRDRDVAEEAKAKEEEEGVDENASFHFTDVPVVSPSVQECGQDISMHSNIKEGDAIEIKLLSDYTCVLRRLSPSALGFHMKEMQKEEAKAKMSKTKVYLLKGNQEYKLGRYERAKECYKVAIDSSSSRSDHGDESDEVGQLDLIKCYANSGLALLTLKQMGTSETMCNTALGLIENLKGLGAAASKETDVKSENVIELWKIKILLRRAKARIGLKRFDDALSDLDKVLDLQPRNKDAAMMKEQIQDEITEVEE